MTRDHLGREFTDGPATDNAGSYGPAEDGEPLERARRRAEGVGPLTNETAGLPSWVVNDRKEQS